MPQGGDQIIGGGRGLDGHAVLEGPVKHMPGSSVVPMELQTKKGGIETKIG